MKFSFKQSLLLLTSTFGALSIVNSVSAINFNSPNFSNYKDNMRKTIFDSSRKHSYWHTFSRELERNLRDYNILIDITRFENIIMEKNRVRSLRRFNYISLGMATIFFYYFCTCCNFEINSFIKKRFLIKSVFFIYDFK